MPARSAVVLALPISCGVLLAQGVIPPVQLGQINPLPGLSTPNVPAARVEQVHLIHLPADPPNVFLVGMTAVGLPPTSGGMGSGDLITGSYDVLTDTFTPNNDAAALNTTSYEFGMMIHHTGLHAVFDRLPGLPWLAARSAIGQPWQIVAQIGPLPSQSYYDPALATFQGQVHLLYVLGTDIAMAPIDLATATLTGTPRVIVRAARAGSTANSPTPVLDPNGELIGLSHHDVLGSDNDHYMSLDLDPGTPAVLLNDTSTWTNNGGFIGGRFFDAENTPTPYHIFAIDTFWFTGGRAPIGGTMHVSMYSPPTANMAVYFSMFAGSDSFLPAGIGLPSVPGLIGINPAAISTVPLVQHNNQNGLALVSFPIPVNPSLSGLSLPAQSATLDALTGQFYFGNTARLAID